MKNVIRSFFGSVPHSVKPEKENVARLYLLASFIQSFFFHSFYSPTLHLSFLSRIRVPLNLTLITLYRYSKAFLRIAYLNSKSFRHFSHNNYFSKICRTWQRNMRKVSGVKLWQYPVFKQVHVHNQSEILFFFNFFLELRRKKFNFQDKLLGVNSFRKLPTEVERIFRLGCYTETREQCVLFGCELLVFSVSVLFDCSNFHPQCF